MLEANLKNLSISGSFHDVAVEMVEAIANIAKKENSEFNSRHALSDINAENINRMDEIVASIRLQHLSRRLISQL